MEQTPRVSLIRRIFGGIAGKKDIFLDSIRTESRLHAIITYLFTLGLNFGLILLFIYWLVPTMFDFLLGNLMLYAFIIVLVHFVLWLMFIAVLHVFCKLSGGKITIGSAFCASAYIYPISSLLLLCVALCALFVKLEIYLLILIPLFLMFVLYLWRFGVLVRFITSVYELSSQRAIVLLLVVCVMLLIVGLLIYFGLSAYLDTLQTSILLGAAG